MSTPPLRYRVRVVGNKYDYVRRYTVLDTQTGRRVPNGPFPKWQAQQTADDMNGVTRDDQDGDES